MPTCPGCGGRNPPELDVCPFCHRRLARQANDSRTLRPRLATLLLAALLVSLVVLVLIHSASIA